MTKTEEQTSAQTARDNPAKYDQGGFHRLLGFDMIEREKGRIVGEIKIDERHWNRADIVHGGVYATMLDSACSGAGLYCPHEGRLRQAITLSLTVNYTGKVKFGTLRVVGRVTNAGYKIYHSAGEIHDDKGQLIAHAVGTFRFLPGSENEEGIEAAVKL